MDTPEKVLKRKHVYKRKRTLRKQIKSSIRRRRPSAMERMTLGGDVALVLDPTYWKR